MQTVTPQPKRLKHALVMLLVWVLILAPIAPYVMAAVHDAGPLPCHTEQQLTMSDCPHCAGEGSAFACQCLDQLNPNQLASPLVRIRFVAQAIVLKHIDLSTPLPHSPIDRQDKPPRYSA